ncbi:MAG: type IV secretory pathway VirB4 protein-like protein, partial [uncultured bacterium]
VEDFLSTDHGKAIITNSSLQILLKQSPAAINKLAEVFYLSGGEKHYLLSANVGEGLFFAGSAHAAIQIIASPEEYQLATTKPQEMLEEKPFFKNTANISPSAPTPIPAPHPGGV